MNTIVIRKVLPDEINILRELSIKTFTDSFASQNSPSDMDDYLAKSRSIESLSQEFSNPESSFYFAVSDGKPVGYLKINWGFAQIECKGQNSLEIQQIYVESDYQNQKIGQLLFDEAVKIAIDNRFDFIWLGVWERNHGAIRFYEKNGFEVFGKHEFMLGSDLQFDLLMKRNLSA